MELIITYLIYILGIIATIAVLAFANVKVKILNLRHDILKMLIKDNKIEKIDLNNYIK